jgi:uroporphyrinogen-III synthase/uroporphyrinogen III methyltransferase/synthase
MAGLGELLSAGRVDAVTFASPSAVHGVMEGLGVDVGRLAGVLLAAIGPTTAEALREAGFTAEVVPDIHAAEALADAVAGMLAGQRGG